MARVGILILFLTLEEKLSVFNIEYDVNCASVINNLIYVELYSLYNNFDESIYIYIFEKERSAASHWYVFEMICLLYFFEKPISFNWAACFFDTELPELFIYFAYSPFVGHIIRKHVLPFCSLSER